MKVELLGSEENLLKRELVQRGCWCCHDWKCGKIIVYTTDFIFSDFLGYLWLNVPAFELCDNLMQVPCYFRECNIIFKLGVSGDFPYKNTYEKMLLWGGWPGLVIVGGDSCSRGREFESLHRILYGHFFHMYLL